MALDQLERSTYLATEARRSDPDRYLCALFAPAERRSAVLGLILFHHELARIPELVSQPMAGLIRYQWWREAVAEPGRGLPPRQHPVVRELAAMLDHGWVAEADLQALIDAREPALDGAVTGTPGELEAFAAATGGALQELVYRVLGGADTAAAQAAQKIGTAFGLIGLLRALAIEARRARPAPEPATIQAVLRAATRRARELVDAGRDGAGRPPRAEMAAFLPATLTDGYVRQIERSPDASHDLTRPALIPLMLWARVALRRP